MLTPDAKAGGSPLPAVVRLRAVNRTELTPEDIAVIFDVSRSTIYMWRGTGLFPEPAFVRIHPQAPPSPRWNAAELEAWIVGGCGRNDRLWANLRHEADQLARLGIRLSVAQEAPDQC